MRGRNLSILTNLDHLISDIYSEIIGYLSTNLESILKVVLNFSFPIFYIGVLIFGDLNSGLGILNNILFFLSINF